MLLLLAMMAQEAPTLADAMARYRALTTARPRCGAGADPDEITVCAGREADRFRLPLRLTAAEPPDSDAARARRLLDTHAAPCGQGVFLVKCGMVGGHHVDRCRPMARNWSRRPLAP